jgi:hypothetical protein
MDYYLVGCCVLYSLKMLSEQGEKVLVQYTYEHFCVERVLYIWMPHIQQVLIFMIILVLE